jgi:hypothetical protein
VRRRADSRRPLGVGAGDGVGGTARPGGCSRVRRGGCGVGHVGCELDGAAGLGDGLVGVVIVEETDPTTMKTVHAAQGPAIPKAGQTQLSR